MSNDERQSPPPGDNETLPPNASSRSSGDDAPTFAADQTIAGTSAHRDAGKQPLQLAGYKILSELGRGGMGVVYKAIDESLDRTVAVKMIIAGRFASSDDVRRFKLEAEAAARLDHSGIVPIYDIGESDGNHYFSMKYIEGSNLAERADEFRMDRRTAVSLLFKVARAVHHAHQRGVLHRDLKPGNILVDEQGEPLVTDLGLAKRLDGESQLTQTGLVMGTPGFMAPEQASGEKEITTAADVFSLGAILHWLVTGKAPFQGETPLQVIMQTIEGQIPSMRASVPDVDIGLELICQKCLQKEPQDRYNSAAALADDLQSWLDGEPLTVRPPNPVTIAQIWFRKNLRAVLGACVCGIVCGMGVGLVGLLPQLSSVTHTEAALEILQPPSGHQWPIHFQFLGAIPRNYLNFLQFGLVLIIFAGAFISTIAMRPKTREACVIYAVTIGLLAGVITHTMSFGWAPVVRHSVQHGTADIQLLADAMFHESETEQHLARTAIQRRYPGIVDVTPLRRGQTLARKVLHDQSIGVPWAMWIGIVVTLVLVTLPIIFCTVNIGFLWVDGKRGGEFFGVSWERSIYTFVIFAFVAICMPIGGPVSAGPLYQLAVFASLILALAVSYLDKSWPWRVGMFFLTSSCMTASLVEADRIESHRSIASRARTPAEIQRAAEYNEKYVSQRDNSYQHFTACILWLAAGNEERYRAHCDRLMSKFEYAYRPEEAERLAKVALLRPDLHDDMPTVYELAEFASRFESNDFARWFYFCRALSEQRQRNGAAALDWNQKCRQQIGELKRQADLAATTYVVDALVHLDQGNTEAAMISLGRSEELARRFFDTGYFASWENRLIYQILQREVDEKTRQ